MALWKRPSCWERLRAGEGDDRGLDGWMASWTQWIWVWVDSGSWLWTGRPGMLWFMWSWRVRNDWASELNWTLKLLILWIIIYCGKHVKKWECRTLFPVSWETCWQVKKQQLRPCIEQMTLSGLRQEYDEAVYWYLVCLTSKRAHPEVCDDGWVICWNQDCWLKYQQPHIRVWQLL